MEKIGMSNGESRIVGAERDEDGFIWIPGDYIPDFDVSINGSSVYNSIVDAKFKKLSDGAGKCEIKLASSTGFDFEINDTINFYLDFEDASNIVWKGNVERIEDDEPNYKKITGRYINNHLLDTMVTLSKADNADKIIKSLINDYAPDFSYNNVEEANKVSYSASEKPLWNVILDIAGLVNYTVYVDVDKDIHFFESGSKLNKKEAIVREDNLKRIKNFGKNVTDVRNIITVYGQDGEGSPIIYTASDQDSIDKYGEKEKVIKENNLSSMESVKNTAESQLELLKEPPTKGSLKTLFLITPEPGQNIWISDQIKPIHGVYNINDLKYKLPENEMIINVSNVPEIPGIFSETKQKDMALEDVNNPEQMDKSYNLTFEDESKMALLSDSKISDGSLVLRSGVSSTTILTKTYTTEKEISEIYMNYKGNDLGITSFEYSVNGGEDWSDMSVRNKQDVSTPDSDLKIRINMSSGSKNTNPTLNSLVLMYD